jgi:hypothetical protein
MKVLFLSKLTIIPTVLVAVVMLMSGQWNYMQINSTSFMHDKEVKFVKRWDEEIVRTVASNPQNNNKEESPLIQFVEFSNLNQQSLNGHWKIYRFTDAQGQSEDLNLIVKMEMVGVSKIKVNNEDVFRISLWRQEAKRMVVFREGEGGFEILEAYKIGADKLTRLYQLAGAASAQPRNLPSNDQSIDLTLREFQPGPQHVGVNQQNVSGELTVNGNLLQNINIIINGETTLSIGQLELASGGTFGGYSDQNREEMVSGVFYDGGTMRFSTGPLAGSIVTFAPKSETIVAEQLAAQEENIQIAQFDNQNLQRINPEAEVIQQMSEQEQAVAINQELAEREMAASPTQN